MPRAADRLPRPGEDLARLGRGRPRRRRRCARRRPRASRSAPSRRRPQPRGPRASTSRTARATWSAKPVTTTTCLSRSIFMRAPPRLAPCASHSRRRARDRPAVAAHGDLLGNSGVGRAARVCRGDGTRDETGMGPAGPSSSRVGEAPGRPSARARRARRRCRARWRRARRRRRRRRYSRITRACLSQFMKHRPALRGLDVQASLAHHLADGLAGHRDLCGGRRLRRRRLGHGRQLREREDREHLRPRLLDRAGRAYQGDVRRFFVTPHLHARLLLQPSAARRLPLADDHHRAVLGGALNVLSSTSPRRRGGPSGRESRGSPCPPGAPYGAAPPRAVVVPPADLTSDSITLRRNSATATSTERAAFHAHLPGVPGRLAGLGFVDQDVRACAFLHRGP